MAELIDIMRIGAPTAEELAQINELRPVGTPEYTAESLIVFPVIASHNLLHRDGKVWDSTALASMAATYPGTAYIPDHEWDDVEDTMAFVFASYLIETSGDRVPSAVMGENPAIAEINQQILAKNNFLAVICQVAIAADHPAITDIIYKRQANVSTGGLMNGREVICPVCGENWYECPHPLSWYMDKEEKLWAKENGVLMADYLIWSGFHTSVELSAVTIGNLPGASIPSQKTLSELVGTVTVLPQSA